MVKQVYRTSDKGRNLFSFAETGSFQQKRAGLFGIARGGGLSRSGFRGPGVIEARIRILAWFV